MKLEPLVWVGALALLSGMVVKEGQRRTALEVAIETAKNVSAMAKLPIERVGHAERNAPVVQPPPMSAPTHMVAAAPKLVPIAVQSRTFSAGASTAAFDGIATRCASHAPGNTPRMSAARQTMSASMRGTMGRSRPSRCVPLPTAARMAPEKPR